MTLLTLFFFPPTIIERFPFMAPISPPETGASINEILNLLSFLDIEIVSIGHIVLISITIFGVLLNLISPLVPTRISSTSLVSETAKIKIFIFS